MCGRLSIHNMEAVRVLANLLQIPQERMDFTGVAERYNTQPTHFLPVIWDDGDSLLLSSMQWGWKTRKVIHEGGSARHINAKSETVYELPTFRQAARAQRCVIVVNGYFEWRRDTRDRPLEPHYIHPVHQDWLAIAGIYHGTEIAQECALLTMAPNRMMAAIHQRMPCILNVDGIGAWLAADTPAIATQALLSVPDDYLAEHIVSDQVNNVRNEGLTLIKAVPPPPRQVDWIGG